MTELSFLGELSLQLFSKFVEMHMITIKHIWEL